MGPVAPPASLDFPEFRALLESALGSEFLWDKPNFVGARNMTMGKVIILLDGVTKFLSMRLLGALLWAGALTSR